MNSILEHDGDGSRDDAELADRILVRHWCDRIRSALRMGRISEASRLADRVLDLVRPVRA